MRVQSSQPAGSGLPKHLTVGGVLLERTMQDPASARKLASRLGTRAPDDVTIAVPAETISRAARALGAWNLAGNQTAGALFDRSQALMQVAAQPLAGLPTSSVTRPSPAQLSEQQVQSLLGIARSATTLFVSHVWPNPMAQNVVKFGWLAYDGYRMVEAWNDPRKSTLACMVDTSKVALETLALLDSAKVFGASPLLNDDFKQAAGAALAIVGDAEAGRDTAITALSLGLDARVKQEADLGDPAVQAQWDLYDLSAKIAEAALSDDPVWKDVKLIPIPHLAGASVPKPATQAQEESMRNRWRPEDEGSWRGFWPR